MLESIFSISVLLLAVLLIINLLPTSWLATNQAEQRLYAGNLAQSILEEKRSAAFDALANETRSTVDAAGARFTPVVEVVPVSDKLKTVRVRIQWTSRQIRREVVREILLCRVPR